MRVNQDPGPRLGMGGAGWGLATVISSYNRLRLQFFLLECGEMLHAGSGPLEERKNFPPF